MIDTHVQTLVVTLALVFAACKFTPSGASSGTGGPDAPPAPGTDAGVDGAPSTPDAPVAPANHCAAPAALADSFDDGLMSPSWVPLGPSYANYEENGELVLAPTDDTPVGYRSKSFVDLTGAAAEVEVTGMVDRTSDAIASFALLQDATHYLALGQAGGTLTAEVVDGGAPVRHGVPFDPAQRWWRIAEGGGTVSFQTSSDHATWTTIYQAATPAFTRAIALELAATAPSGGDVGSATFDDLNTQLPSTGWCKADSLHDPFARTALGSDWLRTGARGGGCSTWVSAGAHADQFGAPSQCWFETSQAYDLTNSSMEVTRVATGTEPAGWTAYLAAVAPTGQYAELFASGGQLCAVLGTATVGCQADDATLTRLRLREASGTLMFEAGDPATGVWTSIGSTPDPFPLDAVSGEFGTASNVDLSAEPTSGSFTAYNEL